jgi:hypothetical protein
LQGEWSFERDGGKILSRGFKNPIPRLIVNALAGFALYNNKEAITASALQG